VERVQVGIQQFEKNVTEALENIIKGVESALEQAMQKKEQAEEELCRSSIQLSQQESSVENIVRQLDLFTKGRVADY
jgi:hypothetical protein